MLLPLQQRGEMRAKLHYKDDNVHVILKREAEICPPFANVFCTGGENCAGGELGRARRRPSRLLQQTLWEDILRTTLELRSRNIHTSGGGTATLSPPYPMVEKGTPKEITRKNRETFFASAKYIPM